MCIDLTEEEDKYGRKRLVENNELCAFVIGMRSIDEVRLHRKYKLKLK